MKINRSAHILIAAATVVGCSGGSGSPLDDFRSQLSANALDPRFSPDGNLIAYDRIVDGQSAIFLADSQVRGGERVSFGIWDFAPRWSPDGEWLAFGRDSGIGDIGDVYMLPATGGEEVPLAVTAAGERVVTWSHDGTGVLFTKHSQTWVAPVDGGEHYPLLDVEDDFWGIPSPDGNRVAYSRRVGGLRTIWMFDRETGEHHQLTEDGFESLGNEDPWSPDGREFGFVTSSTGTGDIWIADVNSGEVRQLTRHLGDDYWWTWSPTGRWISFVSDRGGQTDIWVVRSDGSGSPIRVTDDSRVEYNVRWSPDGSRMIFNHSPDEARLLTVDVSGDNQRTVMVGRAADDDYQLSPDGRTVLFTSSRSGNQDLWTVPIEGGEPTRLTRSALPDNQAMWSPDGESIVFNSRRGGNWDIYTMSRNGNNVVQLTNWPGTEGPGRWSPDGTRIAFTSDHEADQSDIWTVSAEGGEPARVTNLDTRIGSVRWSPDGRDLMFHKLPSATDPTEGVYRVSAAGGAVTELFVGDVGLPRWSPDGSQMVLPITQDGYTRLHVLSADGGTPRRLTGEEREWHSSGRWTPDGNEVVFGLEAFNRGDAYIAAVSLIDGAVRTIVRDTTKVQFLEDLSRDGESVLYLEWEVDVPVDEVRVAELLGEAGGSRR